MISGYMILDEDLLAFRLEFRNTDTSSPLPCKVLE